MHYTAVAATPVVSHVYWREHKPPCRSQGCLHPRTGVTFHSCSPFLAACAPCSSLLLSTSARCMQLASLHLGLWLRRRPKSLSPHCCRGGMVLPSSSSPSTSTEKPEEGTSLQVLEHCQCLVQDVHQHTPTACQSCSRHLCLFGQQLELCSVLKSPSFSRASSAMGDRLYWKRS